AMVLYAQNNSDASIERLHAVVREAGDPTPAVVQLLEIYTSQKKHDEALKLAREVSAKHPGKSVYRILQADVQAAIGQREEAILTLAEAAEQLEGDEAAKIRFA